MSRLSISGMLLVVFAGAACGGDSTAPQTEIKNTGDLHFLRLSASAPQLQSTVVSFYAKKGEDREIRVRFKNGEDYLRFRVFASSLSQRPDGTSFVAGDSV